MLPILVITREVPSMAALALTNEGLEVNEVRMRDYTNYARVFSEQWQSGNGFMVVEEDVVPWPGAMRELDACGHDWCCFMFPNGIIHWEPRSGFCDGLGCMKFSNQLVSSVEYGKHWVLRGWDELDGAVHGVLVESGYRVHVHEPPVAHVKAQVLTYRRSEIPLR